mmetsp:Transcript_51384/g.94997  ORF Transcript_51384/g.94997 Transcript_51384/m.94997 type:complete len:576 (-) Transcript_51384:145-1872(-)
MSLLDRYIAALRARATSAEVPCKEAARLLEFTNNHLQEHGSIFQRFLPSGRLRDDVDPMPASAYNDIYKWTMLPVMRAAEESRDGVYCTVSVNIRDAELRRQLLQSAQAGTPLFKSVEAEVRSMAKRVFDRDLFKRVVEDKNVPFWDSSTFDLVCGPADSPRQLAQEVSVDTTSAEPRMPTKGTVLVQLFVAHDNRLGENRVYIEATGPWCLVTWLETPLMQAVYEALLRDKMRQKYAQQSDATAQEDADAGWYAEWLADAMIRCVKSTDATIQAKLRTVLMSGRRTGGMPLVMLQELYHCYELKDAAGNSFNLGTSNVLVHYWVKDAGVPLTVGPTGTHAHELQMVIGALLADMDDAVGCPLSSAVSHALYFYLSLPRGNTKEQARKVLMPFLPDTLGTEAFLKTAAELAVPHGIQKDEPLLDAFGTARHDSGDMATFKEVCQTYGFKGGFMASEIGSKEDLQQASSLNFVAMGAGGFFGDSESAWDSGSKSISMAAKMLRVYEGPNLARTASHPMKTGDATGKFEADGLLSTDDIARLQRRADAMRAADFKVSREELRSRFEEALRKFPQVGL